MIVRLPRMIWSTLNQVRFITFGISVRGRLLPVLIPSVEIPFASSARDEQRARKGTSMTKVKSEANDWLRSEYTRSDLGPVVRGKYARRMAKESNVVVIDPAVSKAFPNEAAVNAALRGQLELAKSSTRPTTRSTRTCAQKRRAPLSADVRRQERTRDAGLDA